MECVMCGAATPCASPQGAAIARRRSRGSCRSFCRQAGGLGGSPAVAPCHVLSGRIRVAYGIAPVSVRCTGKLTSRGALVIYPHDPNKDYVGDGVPGGSYDGGVLLAPPERRVRGG